MYANPEMYGKRAKLQSLACGLTSRPQSRNRQIIPTPTSCYSPSTAEKQTFSSSHVREVEQQVRVAYGLDFR